MARRTARMLGIAGSALVTLVLAHSLVFLVRYGSAYGEALAHSGHDVAWAIAVASAIGLGLGLAIVGVLQLGRLAREARAAGLSGPSAPGSGLVRRWLVTSAGLIATTAVLLTIQENIERTGAGLPTPGIGLLVSAEYPWAGIVIAASGLAVGFVIALFRWRRDVLIARIRANRQFPRRATIAVAPAWFEPRPAASLLGRALGLRAPPRTLAS
jgi:hypothetical protein